MAHHFPIVWIGSTALSIKCLLFAACKAKNIAGNYKAPNCTKSAQQLLLNVWQLAAQSDACLCVCVCVCVRAVWSSHNSVPALFDIWFLGVLCAFPLLAPFQRIIRAKPGVIFWHSTVQRAQTRRTQMETLKCEAICWVATRSYWAPVTTLHPHSQQNRSSAAAKINTFAVCRSWDEFCCGNVIVTCVAVHCSLVSTLQPSGHYMYHQV